jgi:hypothetical protein
VKVIAFFVRLFSAGSELGLDRKFNRKVAELFSYIFGLVSGLTGNPTGNLRVQPDFGPD